METLAEYAPFAMSRKQFPVKLCFAIAVYKSWDQLETVGVDLRTSDFPYGQIYVALYQVMDVRKLAILLLEDRTYDDP